MVNEPSVFEPLKVYCISFSEYVYTYHSVSFKHLQELSRLLPYFHRNGKGFINLVTDLEEELSLKFRENESIKQ